MRYTQAYPATQASDRQQFQKESFPAFMTSMQTITHRRGRHAVPPPSRVPARNCFDWISEGWHMFEAQPATWVLMTLSAFVILTLISGLLGSLYIVGPMLAPIMLSPLLGGMLYAAREYRDTGAIRFMCLFEGFRSRPGSFLLVGFIFCSILVLILLLLLVLGNNAAPDLLGTQISGMLNTLFASMVSAIFALGAIFLVWSLLTLALLFSPSLIVKDNAAPLDAFTSALHGCFVNFRAILMLVLCLYVLFGLVVVTLGFGALIFVPVLVGTLYAACEDMFPDTGLEQS